MDEFGVRILVVVLYVPFCVCFTCDTVRLLVRDDSTHTAVGVAKNNCVLSCVVRTI